MNIVTTLKLRGHQKAPHSDHGLAAGHKYPAYISEAIGAPPYRWRVLKKRGAPDGAPLVCSVSASVGELQDGEEGPAPGLRPLDIEAEIATGIDLADDVSELIDPLDGLAVRLEDDVTPDEPLIGGR